MIIGYARVSSKDQNLARQMKDLEGYGCDRIITEKISGKDFSRPVYTDMRKKLRFGDILVVHDLSRFGRNKEEIMFEWKSLVEDDIDIAVLNMPILNTSQYKNIEGVGKLVSDIFLQVMSWLVEEERNNIRKAQREGIEIAKKQGKFKGRPVRYCNDAKDPKDRLVYHTIVTMLQQKKSVMDISNYTGVARMTIYRIKNELENKSKEINQSIN
jgi:DNA invertase Pin-like site-specific DNA recombinase